ncbi:hypothetical protein Q0Z83_011060 [Actinoplanes sichuanensis]|nr:hypothetical protein Q0Z83_011060 [Actinoplanes sichuanensis]
MANPVPVPAATSANKPPTSTSTLDRRMCHFLPHSLLRSTQQPQLRFTSPAELTILCAVAQTELQPAHQPGGRAGGREWAAPSRGRPGAVWAAVEEVWLVPDEGYRSNRDGFAVK